MRIVEPNIIVTKRDLELLMPVLEQSSASVSDSLETELGRALIVDPRDVPADVVTMNSEVVYEDCDTHVQRRVKLVFPKDADAARGHVSVLAPIGSALLGLRVDQAIEWRVPSGMKRIRVVEVQPPAQ